MDRSPKGYIYDTTPCLRPRDNWGIKSEKIVKVEDQWVWCTIMFPMSVGNYTHKISPIWVPKHEMCKHSPRYAAVDIDKPNGPQPYTKCQRQLKNAESRNTIFPG